MSPWTQISGSLARLTQELIREKRELVLSILKSTTTKREARNYLAKYETVFQARLLSIYDKENNSLSRASDLKPNFGIKQKNHIRPLALIKFPAENIDQDTLHGIGHSLQKLIKLGIWPIILLDPKTSGALHVNTLTTLLAKADRMANRLDASFRESSVDFSVTHSVFERKQDHDHEVTGIDQVLRPIFHNTVPIVLPVTFTSVNCKLEVIDTNDALQGIARELFSAHKKASLEKIVFVDPKGGIPSIERKSSSHVFINLSQEYSDIVSELHIGFLDPDDRDHHLRNLQSMRSLLELAESYGKTGVTGLITTPHVMALENSQLNPLAYNVLTDRPIVSSSLPIGNRAVSRLSTNVLKLGFEVKEFSTTSFPDGLKFDSLINSGLIEKQKFVNLINDAFNNVLEESRYFERLNGNLATLIIVGDYDGAAVITTESSSEGKSIAYLDKFAISKRNQGLPSMADVIFKAIIQCHPEELFWRSRKTNPINKWYFERSLGSMAVPDSPWKIFFTGEVYRDKISQTKDTGIDIKNHLDQYRELVAKIPPSF